MQTHTTMKRSRGPSDASQYHSRRISVDFRHTSHLTTALSPAEPFPLVYMQDAPETTPYPEHPIRFTQDNPHSLAPHSLSSTWHLDDTMGCEEPSAAWNSGGVVDFEMREPGYGFEQAHKAVRSHSLEWSAGESSHNSVCVESFELPFAHDYPSEDMHLIDEDGYNDNANLMQAMRDLESQTHEYRLQMRENSKAEKASGNNYSRHVKAYIAFVSTRPGLSPIPITAAKVSLFLQYETTRPKRAKNGQDIPGTRIGVESVNQCISALEDHRKNHQHEPEYKACPESQCPLRSDMRIRDFVQQAKKDEHARAANAQKQKAAGVLSNTYEKEQLKKVSIETLSSPSTKNQMLNSIRDRSMLLMATTTAFRGDSLRGLEWSNLSCRDLPMSEIGHDASVMALVLVRDQGKHNLNGYVEEHGSIRHRDVELCGIGALSMHLFGQFHIRNKQVPSFAPDFDDKNHGEFGRRDWWNILVYPGAKSDSERMSYANHRKRVTQIHDDNNITIGKKTHGGRGHTLKEALENRATQEEGMGIGKWSTNKGSYSRYDHSLPIGGLLAVASFNARRPEAYMLPRNSLDPPPELLEAIFPFVEHELAALDDRRKKYGHVAEDFALRDFLTLLCRLRCVLLQDAAIIRAKYPTTKLMLFDYPPFNSTAFQTFSSTALFVIQEAEETSRNALSALPHVVAASMQGILTSISLDRQKSDHKTQALLEGLSQQLQVTMTSDHDQNAQIPPLSDNTLTEESQSITSQSLELTSSHLATITTSSPSLAAAIMQTYNPGIEYCQPESVSTSLSSESQLPSLTPLEVAQFSGMQFLTDTYGAERVGCHQWKWISLGRQVVESQNEQGQWVPVYEFKKNLDIQGIWMEWMVGMDGCLSVDVLEAGPWQAKWKSLAGGKRIATEACRRKAVVSLIQKLAAKVNWNVDLALRFLAERYPIPTRGVTHLRTMRAFIDYLQAKGQNHVDEIMNASFSFP